jgi:hypothetical protein
MYDVIVRDTIPCGECGELIDALRPSAAHASMPELPPTGSCQS